MKKITLQFIVSTFFLFLSNVVLFAQTSFTTNLNQGCAPLSITFKNTTPGTDVYQFSWFFQDGSPTLLDTLSFNQSIIHNYTVTGNFNPSAYVYDITTHTTLGYTNGSTIQVNGVSIGSPDSVCQNEMVNFSPNSNGPVNNTSWNFGDITSGAANTSSQQNPQHTYSAIGTYVVTLVANTSSCGQKTVTKTIYVSNASYPHPHFWTNPSPACPNTPISFNVNSFATYSWNFGDPGSGTANTSTQQNPTHTYPVAGKYYTTLTVTNVCGHSGTTSDTIRTSSTPGFPNGMGIGNQTSICPNQQINYNVYGNTTYPKYVWNFGDGSPKDSTGANVNHIYGSTLTTYTVSCKISNFCGPDSVFHSTVTVTSHSPFPNYPSFNLQVNSSPTCPNSDVSFNAPQGYKYYVWKFGDGSDSVTTTNNYSNHTYGSLQTTFPVSVRVINACGDDTILHSTVKIDAQAYFPNQSWFKLQANTPSCPNSGVNFNIQGTFSNYVWNFGDATPQITSSYGNYTHTYGSTTGNYAASVIITNGCGHDTTLHTIVQIMDNIGFPVQQGQGFQLSGPSTVCRGDQMNWNAPNGYSNYKWKFGDGDSVLSTTNYANHAYLINGPYTASVKITNSCGKDTTLYGLVTVNNSGSFPSWLQIDATPSSSCPNDMIAFSISQGNFQSYTWHFGDGKTVTSTGGNIQHAYDTIGNYTVSCQLTNGCSNTTTVTTTVQVTGSSPVNSDVSVDAQNPACPNDEVFFIVKQGQSNYTYVWNYGDGSPIDTTIGTGTHHIYTGAVPHTYTVTTTVINGCGSTKTLTMTETISGGVTPTLSDPQGNKNWGFPGSDHSSVGSTAGCAGDAIIFYFMGSAANNVWNFGDGNTGTATESMLIYGKPQDGAMPMTIIKHAFAADSTYLISLTITNSCGISVTDTMSIIIGGNQTVSGDMATSPPPFTTCASIDFLAFGGSSYGWNFGDGNTITTSSPTVSHTFAAQGVYVVSVLVTNGCENTATYSRSINVNGVGGPSVTLFSSAPPTCVNGTNGSATISVTSGQPPYVYSWNDASGQTSATVTGLPSGLYNATVTDNIGCATTLAVSITDPAPIVLNVLTTTTGCAAATGTAYANVISGGTGPYTNLWSTGATDPTATGLAAGAYSVVITDAHGCTSAANASISESGGAVLSVNVVTNNSCYGSSNGAIDINVTGTSSYTYVWSNAATTQDITGLAAGSYSVQVTDNNGCKAMLNATITQPSDIVVATTPVHPPKCGLPPFDGSAKAIASGGTAPYTYLWDTNAASQTNDTATALPAGTYTVTVTDSKGCTKDGVISLNNANAPTISAAVTDVRCNGLGDGSINVTVTGGTSSYYYTWSVASSQTHHEDLNSLFPGNYLLHLVDAKQCESYGSYTITQPAVLAATASHTNATCSNSDGTATALPTGGNTSYTYLWTGGFQTTQTATGLGLGSYTVTVTDNKGCIASANTTIGSTTLPTEICMVTVDPLSTHNVIYWEKPVVTNIDSFKIYREDVTNVYTHIGSVAYDSLSEYHDHGVNPNTTTKRYKISALDNCGQESVKSNYHNTIYIVDNGSGQFTWNPLYTIENSANPVNNYVLMRDDNSTGTWAQVASTAGTQNTLVDPTYSSYLNGNWRVETVWGISCTPIRATINTTRSNIKHQSIILGINSQEGLNATAVYPNPANENVSIEMMESIQKANIRIMNSIGQVVYEQTVVSSGNSRTIKQVNTSSFAKGIYTIVIETDKAKAFKKLVIN